MHEKKVEVFTLLKKVKLFPEKVLYKQGGFCRKYECFEQQRRTDARLLARFVSR